MIRLILAAIGVLFICTSNGNEDVISFGALFFVPVIITILWKIGKWLIERIGRMIERHRIRKEWQKEEAAKEQWKQGQLNRQADLIKKYTNSPDTIEMLRVICGSYPPAQFPTKIIINDGSVQGEVNHNIRLFSFSVYRIFSFPVVIETVSNRDELKYVVKPQIALAHAVNALLSNQYVIYDQAEEKINRHTYSDGETYTSITYISRSVLLVRKDTVPNRTF